MCGGLSRAEAERGGDVRPVRIYCGVQVERCAAVRMRQLQAARVQHQSQRAAAVGENAVLAIVAVGGVADDGVKNVLQVATKLVFAPLQRSQFGETVARGGMSPVAGERHFAARQTAVASQRLLRRFLALAVAVGDFVGEIVSG